MSIFTREFQNQFVENRVVGLQLGNQLTVAKTDLGSKLTNQKNTVYGEVRMFKSGKMY